MTLERRNPLPAGRYWIDVFGDNVFIMDGWLQAAGPAAVVENQHLTPGKGDGWQDSGPPLLPGPDALGNYVPRSMWYLFRTTKPLWWVGPVLGFPTIAPASVQTKADTGQRPPPVKGPLDDLFENLPSGEGLGSLAILLGLAWLEFGGKRR